MYRTNPCHRITILVVCCVLISSSIALAHDSITIDMIDVGTGLSLIVRGPDFAVLYDAGSNDDSARGVNNRVMAFLKAHHPDLTTIDHLILSHPHKDHLELLPDVFEAYEITHIWDSGAVNDSCGYGRFALAIKDEGVVFHTVRLEGATVKVKKCNPTGMVTVKFGPRIEKGTTIPLGTNASMTILHVEHEEKDLNENSVVVRMDLNGTRVLFMGDAEAGKRANWADGTPQEGTAEDRLLKCCRDDVAAHILQVGHHGSRTSSRTDFLDAVGATVFLVSSGPKKYSGVTLPDQIVIDELESRGAVHRTDVNDAECATLSADEKIGRAGKAGGCTNIRITLPSPNSPHVAVLPLPN